IGGTAIARWRAASMRHLIAMTSLAWILVSSACDGPDETPPAGDPDPEVPDAGGNEEARCTPALAPRWSFQTPGPGSVFSIEPLGDADGDGVGDVAAASDSLWIDIDGLPGDHFNVLSGAAVGDPQVVWSASPATRRASDEEDPDYASGCLISEDCLSRFADITGDGVPEILLGTAGNTDAVFAIDGATGEKVWAFDSHRDSPDVEVKADVTTVRVHVDVTGDGAPEVIAAVSQPTALAYLFDGASGRVLWRFQRPDTPIIAALSAGDLDGDGIEDVVLGAGMNTGGGGEFGVYAVSGRVTGEDGEVLYNRAAEPFWTETTEWPNFSLERVGDRDGDGVHEVAVASWDRHLYLFSGAGGEPLWAEPAPIDSLTEIVRNAGDLDGDGADDLVLTNTGTVGVPVISGADGALLWRGVEPDDAFGLDRLDDLDGDGRSEIVTAAGDGVIRLYSGASGALLAERDVGPQRALVARAVPDASGDGLADVAVGTQYLVDGGAGGGTVTLLATCAGGE
ncbi:MAG TPA: VCBS repeat-containing protein, partial [Kofleriaceae bacterium]|nr:VCBS repeat-containing protein [Kofleriaceae bacterium]